MGQYTDIVEIVAPVFATPGQMVDVTVKIQNKYSTTIGIMGVGVPEHPGLLPGEYIPGLAPREAWVYTNPGVIAVFAGQFTMPSSSVTIHIYSYYSGISDSLWYLDGDRTKLVNLRELSPVFSNFVITNYRKL